MFITYCVVSGIFMNRCVVGYDVVAVYVLLVWIIEDCRQTFLKQEDKPGAEYVYDIFASNTIDNC